MTKRWIAVLSVICCFSQISFASSPTPYCLALRGNGELAPAHWGGLAQVVERLGLPSAMAGGSSASISLFLLESISQNPSVVGASSVDQRARASLLLKSLESFIEVIAGRPEWKELAVLAAYLKKEGGGEGQEFMTWLKQMVESQPEKLAELVLKNLEKIQSSLQVAIDLGLVDPNTFGPLFVALDALQNAKSEADRQAALAQLNFYSGEVYRSVVLLGKFNAESDHNLFFRSGLVNFQQLASSFGKVANFYSGRNFTAEMIRDLNDFVQLCAPLNRNSTWNQIRSREPRCDQMFKQLVIAYQTNSSPNPTADRDLDSIGKYIPTFPTTAVLRGEAYQKALSSMGRYHQEMSPEFGRNFTVNGDDVFFGYWGKPEDLKKIAQKLHTEFADDAKSMRFFALGETTWNQVLSLSPAEPGLAPLKLFVGGGEPLLSAGGWSDLHPIQVLKANGCERVVYVTRRGGESLFGQGVAKRLFGFPEVPWDHLSTSDDKKAANSVRNNQGNPADQTSQWSRLYNLGNPNSSYNKAIQLADAVLCTDWNRFNVTDPGAVSAMIEEAYQAPWAFRSLGGDLGREAIRRGWRITVPSDNNVDPQLGYRPFAGCLPF